MNFVTSKHNDYIKDEAASYRLARKIQAYWHNLGFDHIKVWVETFHLADAEYFAIRSNITFAKAG